MVKGGTLEAFSTFSSMTSISMSPVGILSFFEMRSNTFPEARTTYSLPKPRTDSNNFLSDLPSSNINWVMP